MGKRPIALLNFLYTLLRCSSNVNLKTNVIPRCFGEYVFLRHCYCLKLKMDTLVSLFYDWRCFLELVYFNQDWNSFSVEKLIHYLSFFSNHHFTISQKYLHQYGLSGWNLNPSSKDRFLPAIAWGNQILSRQGGTVFHLVFA